MASSERPGNPVDPRNPADPMPLPDPNPAILTDPQILPILRGSIATIWRILPDSLNLTSGH
jgi:hypothetical protein